MVKNKGMILISVKNKTMQNFKSPKFLQYNKKILLTNLLGGGFTMQIQDQYIWMVTNKMDIKVSDMVQRVDTKIIIIETKY